MSTPALITAIIATALVLIVALAVFNTPNGRPYSRPCYFDGMHAELTAPGGRKIGAGDCAGDVEYVYSVQAEHPAAELSGLKVCPAHTGAISELAAALSDGTQVYWLKPDQ